MHEQINACPICAYDAEPMPWRHNHHDVFRCSSKHCMILFEQTGLGPELLPSEFEEGEVYGITVWSEETGDTEFELEVLSRDEHNMVCLVNTVVRRKLVIRKESGVEYVTLEDFGIENCIYAYTKESI